MTARILIAVCVAGLYGVPAAAEPMTAELLRQMTEQAVTASNGNPDKVISALNKAAKAQWGEFDAGPIGLFRTTPLAVVLFTPYGLYRNEIREALRKLEPIDDVEYKDRIIIGVQPYEMDAMNIVKIVVQRDGVVVEPLESDLAPHDFQNRMGATVKLYSGANSYPVSAFAPGATMTVTLVPEFGGNIVRRLDAKQLAKLR